jgi:TonB-linked SusC/RagA family outer membrane protein
MRRFTTLFQGAVAVVLVLAGSAVMALAQGRITGKVTDEDSGAPLGGVSIKLTVGTKVLGAFAAKDGKYEIRNVPAGSYDITANYIGFKTQKKKITVPEGGEAVQDFKMGLDLLLLEEAVVIGYGTKTRKEVTSSISSIKATEIANTPVASFDAALQGRAAGVQITADNGLAGAPVTVRVRGTSSLGASSQPLYVVDGVPIISGDFSNNNYADNLNALSMINPGDIESMEILKDAAAAAIYGSRSANGVVLITTKKGRSNQKTTYNFDYQYGLLDVTNKIKMLDGPTYLRLGKEAWKNDGKDISNDYQKFYEDIPLAATSGLTRDIMDRTNTNWIDQVLRTGSFHQAQVSIAGGSDKTRFYAGGAYRKEDGILKGNSFERYSGRLNLEHDASENLTFGFGVNVSSSLNNRVPQAWQPGGLGDAQSQSLPVYPIYNADGTFYIPARDYWGGGQRNIVATLANRTDYQQSLSLLANGFLQWTILPALSFRTDAAINTLNIRDYQYIASALVDRAQAEERKTNVNNVNLSSVLTYAEKFDDIHDVQIMGGFSYQRQDQGILGLRGNGFGNPAFTNPYTAPVIEKLQWQTNRDQIETGFAFLSYFARASYSYSNKYLASFSLRSDGSSRFAPAKRFGTFYAGSLGWIVSEESFLKSNDILSFLKLRASYGLTGNAEIGNFRYFGSYNDASYAGQPGITIGNIGNPNLTWENTGQLSVGFDFSLLNDRISGSIDYYNKQTSGVLIPKSIPYTSGANNVYQNLGKLENTGFEFSLRTFNLVGEFEWTTDINLSANANKILDLGGQELSGPDFGTEFGNNVAKEGYPIGTWRLVRYAGVDPQTGVPLYLDKNGTVTKTFDEANAIYTGQPYPTLFGGVTNTFRYAGFDLSILVTFAVGQNIYSDDGKRRNGSFYQGWNQFASIEGRWQKPGDITNIPKLTWKGEDPNTTRWLYDGSFARIKNITLGYTLPKPILESLGIASVRLFVTAQNYFLFSKFPEWDPELNRNGSGNITQSVTYLSPPQSRFISFGINVGF